MSNGCVVLRLKMLTYYVYAALFRRHTPCPWTLHEILKQLSGMFSMGSSDYILEVKNNYLNVIFANVLVAVIITIGFMLLIIPGIIFACKLAFVPYLVVEDKLDAVEAIKKSWTMTRDHAFTIFIIGFIAFFLAIAGLIVFIVGILIAVIWIRLAFATLYHSVKMLETKPTAT